MNRPRNQGTKLERDVRYHAIGVGLTARRLAEAGILDEGDVEIIDATKRAWIVEAKSRAALNLHEEWVKARRKAPAHASVVVVWKRLVRKGGNTRRVAAGPTLVALPLDDFLALLGRVDA